MVDRSEWTLLKRRRQRSPHTIIQPPIFDPPSQEPQSHNTVTYNDTITTIRPRQTKRMEMRLGILLTCVVIVAWSGIYYLIHLDNDSSHNTQTTTNRSSSRKKDTWNKGVTQPQDDCHHHNTPIMEEFNRNQPDVPPISTASSTLVVNMEKLPASNYAPKQFSISSLRLSLSNNMDQSSSSIIPVVETLFKEGIVQIHNHNDEQQQGGSNNKEEGTHVSLDKGIKQKNIRFETTNLSTDESESRRILSMSNHPCFFEYPIPNGNDEKQSSNDILPDDDCWNPSMLPEDLFHFVDRTGQLLTEAFLLFENTAHERTKHHANMGSRIETEAVVTVRSLTTTTTTTTSQDENNDGSILAIPTTLSPQDGPALHLGNVRTSVQSVSNPHYVLHSQERMHFISAGRRESQAPWKISSSAGLFVVLARIPSWKHDSETNKSISTQDDANKGIESVNGDKNALLYMERRKKGMKVAALLSSNEIYVLMGEDAVTFLATKDKHAIHALPFGLVPQPISSEDINDEGKQRGQEVWYSRTYKLLLNHADDGKTTQQKGSHPCIQQSDATSGGGNKENDFHHGHMHPGHDETLNPDNDDDSFCKRSGHPMVMFMDGYQWSIFGKSRTQCLGFYFSRWNLDTYAKFAGAVFVAMLLSILTEGLSNLRQAAHKWLPRGKCRKAVILIIHVMQNFMGYIIMLASMTYSMELTLAVVVGLMLGHFLFFDDSSVQQQRHSHPPTLGSSRQAVAPEPRQHHTII